MSGWVWALGDPEFVEHMDKIVQPDARRWILTMIDSMSHAQFVHLLVSLWAIWYARRKAIIEDEFQSCLSAHLFVQSFISETN